MKTKKNGGGDGISPPGKNQNRNQFIFLSFGVDPLSFIEIGEMACSTTAGCSRGHALKTHLQKIVDALPLGSIKNVSKER